jgi:ankyrin repeat protein
MKKSPMPVPSSSPSTRTRAASKPRVTKQPAPKRKRKKEASTKKRHPPALAGPSSSSSSDAARAQELLLHGDTLELVLFELTTALELCSVMAVCWEFCAAARRLLRSVPWRAAHLTLHELLRLHDVGDERELAAVLSMRCHAYPAERLVIGGPHRLTPLHDACQLCAPTLAMRALVDDVTARKRTRGRLPLHTAAVHGARDAVAVLLDAFPGGAQLRDGDGCLALHLAAAGAGALTSDATDAEHVERLSVLRREEPPVANRASSSPACPPPASVPSDGVARDSRGIDDAVASLVLLLHTYPDGAQDVDLDGMLPLHHAMLHRAPIPIVRVLLEAFPAGAMHEGRECWTPLSLAILYGASPSVVAALLACWPEAVERPIESFGCLPLHLAAKHQSTVPRTVELILAAHPNAAREPDAESRLPLHLAAANNHGGVDERVIAALLRAHPDAASSVDADGAMPLHSASLSGLRPRGGASPRRPPGCRAHANRWESAATPPRRALRGAHRVAPGAAGCVPRRGGALHR